MGRPESAVPAALMQPSMETRINHIAPRAEPLIREIPLSRLALAPENVRKTPLDGQTNAELKASIAALGPLENLVVRTEEPDPGTRPGQAAGDAEFYAVVAAGRRLKAMQALVEDDVLDADHPAAGAARVAEIDQPVALPEPRQRCRNILPPLVRPEPFCQGPHRALQRVVELRRRPDRAPEGVGEGGGALQSLLLQAQIGRHLLRRRISACRLDADQRGNVLIPFNVWGSNDDAEQHPRPSDSSEQRRA